MTGDEAMAFPERGGDAGNSERDGEERQQRKIYQRALVHRNKHIHIHIYKLLCIYISVYLSDDVRGTREPICINVSVCGPSCANV